MPILPLPTAASMHAAEKSQPRNTASALAPMPCPAKAGQRSPARTPPPFLSLCWPQDDEPMTPRWLLWLSHAARERNRAVGVRTRRRLAPKRGVSASLCPRAVTADEVWCSWAKKEKKKIGRRLIGPWSRSAPIPSIKGGPGSEGSTTLPHHSPHRASLSCPALEKNPLDRARASSSVWCCGHGGSAAAPAVAGHVHKLRGRVLRVQAGRAGRDDAEGHRLRVRQGRGLHADDAERAVLQHAEGGGVLLHRQQLLPEERAHGRHLRLRRCRHAHHHRPQLRQLQVRLRIKRRRRRRHGWWWRRYRRRRCWCRNGRRRCWCRNGRQRCWCRNGRRHGWRWCRHRRWYWSSGFWSGRRSWHRHGRDRRRRRGDDDTRQHPEPTVRQRVRPVGRRHWPRLQRGRRAPPRPRLRRGHGRRAAHPPLHLLVREHDGRGGRGQ